ncbi:hypothetical protein C8039_05325 [Halogeometricum sp. wsp3]|nr:hypothetical protein C8039_05325 [Halogeometricum sp. wsp3]
MRPRPRSSDRTGFVGPSRVVSDRLLWTEIVLVRRRFRIRRVVSGCDITAWVRGSVTIAAKKTSGSKPNFAGMKDRHSFQQKRSDPEETSSWMKTRTTRNLALTARHRVESRP